MKADYKFSFYTSNVKSRNHQSEVISLNSFLEGVKAGYKNQVQKVRTATGADQVKLKTALPYATISGIFAPGTRKAESLVKHSGLLQVDIDGKANGSVSVEDLKTRLSADPVFTALFLSPTGTGLKGVVKINPEDHTGSFKALETYLKETHGITIDPACKDVCRPFFISWDETAHINENSPVFSPKKKSATPTSTAKKTAVTGLEKRLQDIEALCIELERTGTDITNREGYTTWRDIGFAIANGLGETGRAYYHRISSLGTNYQAADTDKQFNACMKNPTGGRRWETLFGIAKDFHITVNGTGETQIAKPESLPASEKKEFKFYEVVYTTLKDGTKQYKGIEIDELNFIRLLASWGFRRYDTGKDSFGFVRIQDNVITEVTPQQIQDEFLKYVKRLPEQVEKKVSREQLLKLCLKKIERLFGKALLSTLTSDKQIEFNQDSKNESYFYFKNGFVKCTTGDYSFHPYTELKNCIWSERIINRDFIVTDITEKHNCNFIKFLNNVCGNDQNRFNSLCTIIGYLLHDYHEGKLKAVVLTDSNLSEENEGRTGKTLFGKALSQVRNICELNGKDFKPEEKFKYQAAQLSTQIIFLNDARRNFNLETLYNDITEGISIEKKNQNPVSLKVKYLITTNAVIKTAGASSLDRVIEFEFANYYSHRYSPEMEFKQWFFKDWTVTEWREFDNFLMLCVATYLAGNVVQVEDVNLHKRKFIATTCKQFQEYIESGHIKPREEFSLQGSCTEFQELFPDFNFNSNYPTRRFSKWLKELPRFVPEFEKLKLEFVRKNSVDHYYIFQ